MNRLLILLFILIDVNVLFSQETLSDTYTPSGNGYIMTVPFEFKFLNCIGSDGIPHLSVGKITKNAVSNKYKYNGKIYTEEDLGSESFSNMTKYIGYTDIEVVIWDGNWQLGTVRLTNVTGYSVGCQGQLYDVFKKLGINGKEYKEKINLLSIGNIRIIKISNSDAGLEMKIKDYDKNNKIKSLIDDANYSFSYMRYEDAENICNEIKKIDYSNARANEILEKIKVIRKEETKKLDYNQFISKGDNYYAKKDFTNAIQEYKSALNTGYDNEKALNKVREAETAEEKNNDLKEKEEEKEEVEKPELGKIQTQQKENKSNDKETEVDDLEEFKESADGAAARRRIAERRKEEEAKKKREFEKSRKKAEKSLGEVFSSGISSLVDGEGTLKFVYGIRNIEGDQPLRSPLGASTLEIGAGLGKIGLFVGYSLVDNQNELDTDTDTRRTIGSGGTWAFGLDLTIFKFKFLNSGAEIGINGEYGIGKLEFKEITSTGDYVTNYSSNFYSAGLQLRFLNFLYVSYNYGLYETTETRGETSVLDPVNGKYTKLGFGIKYDFGY